jgi:hypothetical protein
MLLVRSAKVFCGFYPSSVDLESLLYLTTNPPLCLPRGGLVGGYFLDFIEVKSSEKFEKLYFNNQLRFSNLWEAQ